MTTIQQSTDAYEAWLRARLGADLVEEDVDEKHDKMRHDSFGFLRATYWRWSEIVFAVCPDLAAAPEVLSIGDTHLENFGTWRDSEGRLVWGANDFDDAATMPYRLDLVRLATSAALAQTGASPSVSAIAAAILAGYRRGLANPKPIILERDHKWLRDAVLLENRERKKFWAKFDALEDAAAPPDDKYVEALRASLPDPGIVFRPKPRQAGTGSLGRPRFVAMVDWRGGPVLREVKALTMSAWSRHHDPAETAIHAGTIADGRARSPDPQYKVIGDVLVRRLSPNSRKIEVDGDLDVLLSQEMLELMGMEIANCHANDATIIPAILGDLVALDKRGGEWLNTAAETMAAAINAEQAEYAAGG
ncbi:MAG: DUF2252 family protein [Rhizobium sp.]